ELLRKDSRRAVLDRGLRDRGPGPEEIVGQRMELTAVLAALQNLPEADRAALLMRAQDGMSHEEIAAALDLSVVAVKVKIHRARLRLRNLRHESEEKP